MRSSLSRTLSWLMPNASRLTDMAVPPQKWLLEVGYHKRETEERMTEGLLHTYRFHLFVCSRTPMLSLDYPVPDIQSEIVRIGHRVTRSLLLPQVPGIDCRFAVDFARRARHRVE